MLRHSRTEGHELWLMLGDVGFYRAGKRLFGDMLRQAGETTFYMGSNVVPVLLEVEEALEPMRRYAHSLNPLTRAVNRRLLRFFDAESYGEPAAQPASSHSSVPTVGSASLTGRPASWCCRNTEPTGGDGLALPSGIPHSTYTRCARG